MSSIVRAEVSVVFIEDVRRQRKLVQHSFRMSLPPTGPWKPRAKSSCWRRLRGWVRRAWRSTTPIRCTGCVDDVGVQLLLPGQDAGIDFAREYELAKGMEECTSGG